MILIPPDALDPFLADGYRWMRKWAFNKHFTLDCLRRDQAVEPIEIQPETFAYLIDWETLDKTTDKGKFRVRFQVGDLSREAFRMCTIVGVHTRDQRCAACR
jgi:hypothetical protein